MGEFADDAIDAAFHSAMSINRGDDNRIKQRGGNNEGKVLYRCR